MQYDSELTKKRHEECNKQLVISANKTVNKIEKIIDTAINSTERKEAKKELVQWLSRQE